MGHFVVAGVFDRVDEAGRPYFSPDRPRLLDADERDRLGRYLSGCPLVVASPGFEDDPLDPARGPSVPYGYRSDGLWIWSEAAAYYVREYGIAPHRDLYRHIREAEYRLPTIADDVLNAAGEAAFDPVQPEPVRETRYFASVYDEYPVENPAGLLRQWYNDNGSRVDEALGRDLRWRSTARFIANDRSGEYCLPDIDERHAATVVDRWWRKWTETGS